MNKTFINENGKEVTFGVVSFKHADDPACNVLLFAEGSDSETSWEITHQEAVVLHQLLGTYLSTE